MIAHLQLKSYFHSSDDRKIMTFRDGPFERMNRLFDQTRESMWNGVDTNVTVGVGRSTNGSRCRATWQARKSAVGYHNGGLEVTLPTKADAHRIDIDC